MTYFSTYQERWRYFTNISVAMCTHSSAINVWNIARLMSWATGWVQGKSEGSSHSEMFQCGAYATGVPLSKSSLRHVAPTSRVVSCRTLSSTPPDSPSSTTSPSFMQGHMIDRIREFIFLNVLPTALSVAVSRTEATRLFGPDLPPDVSFERVPCSDPALTDMTFKVSYDEGFGGHFSVPQGNGAVADFTKVISKEDPFAFIQDHLRFHPASQSRMTSNELVIFSNGVNNLHAVKSGWEGEWPSPHRLQRVVDVLRCPMALMHLGTEMDQGPAMITFNFPVRWFLRAARAALGRRGDFLPAFDGKATEWHPKQRDNVEYLFSRLQVVRPLIKDHILQLLQSNESAKRNLVFMPYSRSTAEMSGALKIYIEGYGKRHGLSGRQARLQAMQLLRETVTVVSFGNADSFWPDGPAYVHMVMVSDDKKRGTDPISRQLGVYKNRPRGAGADAVFLECDGVFNGMHSHSILASGAPALRLVMEMNGVTSFRGLWEALREENGFRFPDRKMVEAAVVVSGGVDWLEDVNEALGGIDLPSQEHAKELVGQWF